MSTTKGKPELLSPAGSLKNMRYALAYGADAVYAGQPRYSLRVRNNEFNHARLAEAIDEVHAQGKKLYVVNNIAPHNSKLKTFLQDLRPVVEMNPDALIMSDPGLIMLVRDAFPNLDIHLSVQANAVNWATVRFWQQEGIKRVILSRELALEEIEEIRQRCPDIELEVFVHGALCMAYSGRCLLSGYMNKRDPNQGTCTNACRWQYQVHGMQGSQCGGAQEQETAKPQAFLQEALRPDELMPVFEDEHGTYIMNSKDLRAVQHVQRLIEIGVDSLKIEGRTKSFYYCARTAQVYRRAIDDAVSGKPFNVQLLEELEKLANRGYTEGFLRRHTHDEYQNYEDGSSVSDSQQLVGEVLEQRADGSLLVEVKNKFMQGCSLELMTPGGNYDFTLTQMHTESGLPMQVAPGAGYKVWVKGPDNVRADMGILMRNLPLQSTTRQPFYQVGS